MTSLCMAICRVCVLFDEAIVAGEQHTTVSKVCNAWLVYLNDDKCVPAVPHIVHTSNVQHLYADRHPGKFVGDTTVHYNYHKTHVYGRCCIQKKQKTFN